MSHCMSSLGTATYSCGDYPNAKRLLEAALQVLKKTLGNNDREVCKCLFYLGMASLGCHELLDSKPYLEAAKDICIKFYILRKRKSLRKCPNSKDCRGVE